MPPRCHRWSAFGLCGWGLLALACAVGCTKPNGTTTDEQGQHALSRAAITAYGDIAFAAYADAAEGARTLELAVDALVASPSDASLTAARTAWLAAREPYLQTEVFRFYDGPIDAVERWVNPWPIDEAYVESHDPATGHGVIDDAEHYPVLSAQLLKALNEKQGETSISTGFHVIEFLLWGRDERADGPGARSFHDYLQTGATAATAARRATYLALTAKLLTGHLEQVRDAWLKDGRDNYRTSFEALPPSEALARMIKGMGTLSGGELAGERLTVPYETRDQENEHSCFSDNTHRDVLGDALGIQNVCLGRYVSSHGKVTEGPGLCAVLAERDPGLGAILAGQIVTSVAAARALPAPFDQGLLGSDATPGRTAIRELITALLAQAKTLERAASALGAALPMTRASR